MSLADKPVYPNIQTIEPKYFQGEPYGYQIDGDGGLTYKQWLVGMLASNPESFLNSRRDGRMPIEGIANYLSDLADAIIKELEKQ